MIRAKDLLYGRSHHLNVLARRRMNDASLPPTAPCMRDRFPWHVKRWSAEGDLERPAIATKSGRMTHVIKLELLQCRYPHVRISSTCKTDYPRGLLASRAHSPGGEQASTAKRHRNHNESREDQRRGEMLERLPIP